MIIDNTGVNSGTSIRWFGAQFPYLSSQVLAVLLFVNLSIYFS
jgi:hypothetical protein